MPPAERREYAGNAPPTTLSSGIDNATLTIPITSGTGWPTGVVGPFFAVIDKGLSTEEKVKCASRTANVLTVIAGGRGQDGTSAATHSGGATIEHVITADDLNVMNAHTADTTLDHHTQYHNAARHAATVHTLAMLDLTTLTSTLLPPGCMWDYAGAAVPTGWLECNGQAVNRITYAALYAALGGAASPWGQGDGTTTFNVPDAQGRATVGRGTGSGLTARILADKHGAETFTLSLANLASHAHTVGSHNHGGAVVAETQDHAHNANHGHTADDNSTGDHTHNTSLNEFGGFAIRHGGAANGLASSPAERATFSNMTGAGTHDHNITVNPQNFNTAGRNATHNHGVNWDSPGTDAQGSGAAKTHLGPRLTVIKIIKT